MKKRVFILAAAGLLALLLAIPASASNPTQVSGSIAVDMATFRDQTTPVGDRCFVNVWYNTIYDGDIEATCATHEWQVAHGPCEGSFPGSYKETIHLEADCSATIPDLGKSGTFHLRGNGQIEPAADPPEIWVMHWQEKCVIQAGTGDLANLHGSLTLESHPGQPSAYSGQIHFDPDN
jgi:hypothetical protein